MASTRTSLRSIVHCYVATSCKVEAFFQEAEEEAVRDLVMVEQILTGNGIVDVCNADFSVVDDRLHQMSDAYPCHPHLFFDIYRHCFVYRLDVSRP